LSLCYHHRAFLFQVRPDIITQGYLTDDELELWGRFFEDLREHQR